MRTNSQEALVRKIAHDLLAEGRVDVFVGWERGTRGLGSRPAFLTRRESVDRLICDPTCGANLAAWIVRIRRDHKAAPPKIGIVAKGCDARSVSILVDERQVPRDQVHIVGVACPGIVDDRKLRERFGGARLTGVEAEGDGRFTVVGPGLNEVLRREEVLQETCLDCRYPNPVSADDVVGEARPPAGAARDRLAGLDRQGRWDLFMSEISGCIRCNACREACPSCYCVTCFADQSDPRWIGASTDKSDVALFHLGRMMHLAGRCTDCGACVRACPSGVDLRPFAGRVKEEVKRRFGHEAGLAPDGSSALTSCRMDDAQDFMTGV